MWTCTKCGERHAAHLSSCWKCLGMTEPPRTIRPAAPNPLGCARCDVGLEFAGTKSFSSGGQPGLLTALGDLFPGRDRLDVYVCPRCGRLELLVEGIGGADQGVKVTSAPGQVQRVVSGPDLILRQAAQLESNGEVSTAIQRYEELATGYPGTDFAREAEMRVRKIQERLDTQQFQKEGSDF